MPNVSENDVKFAEDSSHEMVQEASWTGFEVEVENDSNESLEQTKSVDSSDEIELIESTSCINDSKIIVECLEGQPRSTGNVISIVAANPVVGHNSVNKILHPNLKNEIRPLEAEKVLGAVKPTNFSQPANRNTDRYNSFKVDQANNSFFKLSKKNLSLDMKDEYAAFAMYVQQELKKITNPYALQMTKFKINQVLFEGTTGAYQKGTVHL